MRDTDKWTFLVDRLDDEWRGVFDSKEEAIEAGREECPDQEFYVAPLQKVEVSDLVDIEWTLEQARESFYDEYSPDGEPFELTKTQKDDLQNLVLKWFADNKIEVNHFTYRNNGVKRIESCTP